MRNHRFRRQIGGCTVFAGITARTLRTTIPPAGADKISTRVWLETSHVTDSYSDVPRPLPEDEARWLGFGLRQVADDIERAEAHGHVVIAVQALEIVLVDYVEAALAPAIAGWAAEEFGFEPHRVRVTRDQGTGEYEFAWDR